MNTAKSPAQAKAELQSRGVVIAEWADRRGFSRTLVYQVLAGQKKCLRGQSHEVAVALGLKRAIGTDATENA